MSQPAICAPAPSKPRPAAKSPGDFHARCNLLRWVPEKKLDPIALREAKEAELPRRYFELESGRRTYGQARKGRWEIGYATCAGYETTDRALFEAHLLEHHSRKPGSYSPWRGGFRSNTVRATIGRQLWKTPRPVADLYEPAAYDLGATVTWRELVETGETYTDGDGGSLREVPVREWVERTGQVWCVGSENTSLWVVPSEPRLPGEAVLVRTGAGPLGSGLEQIWTWSSAAVTWRRAS